MTQNIKDKIGTWGLKIAGFVVLGMQVLKYYKNTLEFTTGEAIPVFPAEFGNLFNHAVERREVICLVLQ